MLINVLHNFVKLDQEFELSHYLFDKQRKQTENRNVPRISIPEITVPTVVNATAYTAVYKVIYTFTAVLLHVTSVF